MVDPVSITLGVAAAFASIGVGAGLYLFGQSPDHIVNMREVGNYYRRQQALEALDEDIDDTDEQS